MLLHRKNNYEWRYIGLWFDMLPEVIRSKIKSHVQVHSYKHLLSCLYI